MHYIKIILKNTFIYRWSVFFATLSSVIGIAVWLLLWSFLYKDNVEMIDYMVKYTVISNVISLFYCKNITKQIGNKVATGDFVLDLIKPVNIFIMAWQMELANMITQLILRGIPVIVVFSYYLIRDSKYHNIVMCVVAVFLNHILFILMYSWIGFLAYMFVNVWPFQRLLDDSIRLLGGGVIPLMLLDEKLYFIANILPFRFLYSFPLGILLGNIEIQEIEKGFMVESVWIVIMIAFNYITYMKAVKKVVIQGG